MAVVLTGCKIKELERIAVPFSMDFYSYIFPETTMSTEKKKKAKTTKKNIRKECLL